VAYYASLSLYGGKIMKKTVLLIVLTISLIACASVGKTGDTISFDDAIINATNNFELNLPKGSGSLSLILLLILPVFLIS
jgi:hypothetical protein